MPSSASLHLPPQREFPLLTVVEGEKFVVQNSRDSAPIVLPKPFPDLELFCGTSAIENAEHWKRIHTLAERCYRPCKNACSALLDYDKTGQEYDKKKATNELEQARNSFGEFWKDVTKLPEVVQKAQPIDLASNIYPCFNVLLRIVLFGRNHRAFPDSVDLMGWICDWLLSCLTRADDVLEAYFAERKKEFPDATSFERPA